MAERRAAIQGFVYAPFRMNDFMDGVLTSYQHGIDIAVYVGNKVDSEHLLYASSDSLRLRTETYSEAPFVKSILIGNGEHT